MKDETFFVAFISSTTYLSCPGALIPSSIIIFKACDKIENNYSYAANIQYYSQTSVFSHLVLIPERKGCFILNNSMILLLCAAVVDTSSLLLYDRKTEHISLN